MAYKTAVQSKGQGYSSFSMHRSLDSTPSTRSVVVRGYNPSTVMGRQEVQTFKVILD